MYSAKDRMIIALDFPTADQAKELVEKIGDGATFYKVGLELLKVTKGAHQEASKGYCARLDPALCSAPRVRGLRL